MGGHALTVMVLAGGPDRERPVSQMSGAQVAAALRQAGHEVLQRDVLPQDLSALDEFAQWGGSGGDVIFPVLHGGWGEGGPLQHILDMRGLPYVGCSGPVAELCMDKHHTKMALEQAGLPTPPYELLAVGQRRTIPPPVVIKAPCEGSSIDLAICHDADSARKARKRLRRRGKLLVERFIAGKEMTVGVIGKARPVAGYQTLPPIRIVPAVSFYDYDAKYHRDDTRYLFEPNQIGLSQSVLDELDRLALETHRVLGCRHLSRVDFIVDEQDQPWILEVNTMPGFTAHSLLPMPGAHAGLPLPALVDRLVRLAADK